MLWVFLFQLHIWSNGKTIWKAAGKHCSWINKPNKIGPIIFFPIILNFLGSKLNYLLLPVNHLYITNETINSFYLRWSLTLAKLFKWLFELNYKTNYLFNYMHPFGHTRPHFKCMLRSQLLLNMKIVWKWIYISTLPKVLKLLSSLKSTLDWGPFLKIGLKIYL